MGTSMLALTDFRDPISDLCRGYHVKYLAVFGSATSEHFSPQSDVDFLVEFQDALSAADYANAYFSLKRELEVLLARPVDLVTRRSLTNPYFRESVMAGRQELYAA